MQSSAPYLDPGQTLIPKSFLYNIELSMTWDYKPAFNNKSIKMKYLGTLIDSSGSWEVSISNERCSKDIMLGTKEFIIIPGHCRRHS